MASVKPGHRPFSPIGHTRRLTQLWRPYTPESRNTFWRALQTFSLTRIVIASVLLIYVLVSTHAKRNTVEPLITSDICLLYLVISVGFAGLAVYWRKRFIWQLLAQMTFDLAAISTLYLLAGGVKSGLAILYLFPLVGCAIMVPPLTALFFVSVVSLIMLGESIYQFAQGENDPLLSLAGLYGGAFFAAVFLINRLAARLITQETLVIERGRELRMQEAINRLVLAEMSDGILVVGPNTEVFAANPAVERLLALPAFSSRSRFRLDELPSLGPIASAYRAWADGQRTRSAPEHGVFVVVKLGEDLLAQQGIIARARRRDLVSRLKLRFLHIEVPGLPRDRAVIILQDVSEIENQAQQLKLASMGRLTASIAHEVRNPLSAIAHAASLLREDAVDAAQQRLLKIVSDNVARLNRMIEDILKLSRRANAMAEPLRLAPFFEEVMSEFRQMRGLNARLIAVTDMQDREVHFDPLHLREVVVNLLSNALRYASGCDGSIQVMALETDEGRLEIHVQDDGPPIEPEVRAHLFEPFYTTSSKGTGLGLYVARELCLNNGAMLDYEYRIQYPAADVVRPTGRFVITMAVTQTALAA